MAVITGKHLSRRTVLRGMGACVALPYLEAMEPAGRSWQVGTPTPSFTRLVCIEESMGAAGSSDWGDARHLFAPAQVGREFEFGPDSQLAPLAEFRDYMTIVSNTDCRSAEAFRAEEIGGDHDRSTAVFLTQAHPKQTQGSDIFLGTSIDQLHARRIGRETVLPSLELCIEGIDRGGGCAYNYHCAYTTSLAWASPDRPLPAIREPRVVFERLFGAGDTPADRGHAGGPGGPPADRPQPDRLDRDRGHPPEAQPGVRGSRRAGRVRRSHPRDRAAHPIGRGA